MTQVLEEMVGPEQLMLDNLEALEDAFDPILFETGIARGNYKRGPKHNRVEGKDKITEFFSADELGKASVQLRLINLAVDNDG